MIGFEMNLMWIEYAKTFIKNITNIYKNYKYYYLFIKSWNMTYFEVVYIYI